MTREIEVGEIAESGVTYASAPIDEPYRPPDGYRVVATERPVDGPPERTVYHVPMAEARQWIAGFALEGMGEIETIQAVRD